METAKFKFLLFVVYLFNTWSVAQATQCLKAERRDMKPGPPVLHFRSKPCCVLLTG